MKLSSMVVIVSLATALVGVPPAARAQGMFAGYAELCDVPVIVARTPQGAVATRDRSGQPVIYVDPGVMANWTTSRVFAIAHECGHHVREHITPQGIWWRSRDFWATRDQELDADCWAASALASQGYYLRELERAAYEFAMSGPFMQGNYPSGQERAAEVIRCARGPDPAPYFPPVTDSTDSVRPLAQGDVPQWSYRSLAGTPQIMRADLKAQEHPDSAPATLAVVCARFDGRPPSLFMFVFDWQVRFRNDDLRVNYRFSSGAERSEIWTMRLTRERDAVNVRNDGAFFRELTNNQAWLDIRVYRSNGMVLRAAFDLRGARAALAQIANMCSNELR